MNQAIRRQLAMHAGLDTGERLFDRKDEEEEEEADRRPER